MDLVAIYHRISILVRRHERHETLGFAAALCQEVLQVKQLHLFLLFRGFPARLRVLVIRRAGELDQPKASLEVGIRETGSGR